MSMSLGAPYSVFLVKVSDTSPAAWVELDDGGPSPL